MTCFNQGFFDPPRRRITQAWADTGLGVHQLETKHIPGSIFWRMGDSGTSWERNATSPWWISQATFDDLVTTAERLAGDGHRLDRVFRRLVRMKLAVLPSWGAKHDLVIRLSLRSRARVIHGRGRFVEDNKDNVHYRGLGAFEIEQVFLPGLSFPATDDPAKVAQAPRVAMPGWQDHVDVRQFDANSYFLT